MIRPLLAEWEREKAAIAAELERAEAARSRAARMKRRNDAERRYRTFLTRLREFTVLDPACGSGNFLYLALQAIKDLEPSGADRGGDARRRAHVPRGQPGQRQGHRGQPVRGRAGRRRRPVRADRLDAAATATRAGGRSGSGRRGDSRRVSAACWTASPASPSRDVAHRRPWRRPRCWSRRASIGSCATRCTSPC